MGVPALTLQMTMGEALRRITRDRPHQEAVVCGPLRLTYKGLQERVDQATAAMAGMGVGKGDRVALRLPPGAAFVTLFFAAAERGAVVVPIDPMALPRRVARVVEQISPRLVVTCEPLPPDVEGVLPEDTTVVVVEEERGAVLPSPTEGPAAPTDVTPQDLLAILYTSGTTGTPKGVMHTHRSLIAPVAASLKLRELWIRRPTLSHLPRMGRALARYGERLLRAAGRPQVFLSTVGFHTITGVEVFLQALLMGDTLVIQPHFHPVEALELIQRERVTILVAVPTALAVMLRLKSFHVHKLRFGEHQIFHRETSNADGRRTVFSISNMLKPGTLIPEETEVADVHGLGVFMQIPCPIKPVDAFND
ncbi:MAG TPA: hypothetical protein EYP52_06765, partial [Anaerolineae bacterium]|nr:hypothetical protein [Anaerolineae bacterium]